MEVIRTRGDTQISLYRGDTKSITIKTKKDNQPSVIEAMQGAFLTLTVRDPISRYLMLKKSVMIDGDNVVIRLGHDDTKCIPPGKYVYDLEYRTKDDKTVSTIIKDFFYVYEDVTY